MTSLTRLGEMMGKEDSRRSCSTSVFNTRDGFITPVHCDDLIDDETLPECLREFLRYNRLPAVCKQAGQERNTKWLEPNLHQYIWTDPEPVLFADHDGKRVRVVMASRFGDVGITENLSARRGYDKRVSVSALSNFSTTMKPCVALGDVATDITSKELP